MNEVETNITECNNDDVAIYEVLAERPTKLRIKKAIFVLKANIKIPPAEIIKITKAWTEIIDFQQTTLLNSTKTKSGYSKTKTKVKRENINKYTQYYTISIYKMVITAIYQAYEEKLNTSTDIDDHYLSNVEMDLIMQKFYRDNNENTIRNKRTAYVTVLQNDGYMQTKDDKHANNLYKFIKRPEWIPEIDKKELQDRRLIELQTMRKN